MRTRAAFRFSHARSSGPQNEGEFYEKACDIAYCVGGFALMFVAFTPIPAPPGLGAGAIIPVTAATCIITHTPIIRIGAVCIVGSAGAGISNRIITLAFLVPSSSFLLKGGNVRHGPKLLPLLIPGAAPQPDGTIIYPMTGPSR